MKSWEKSQISLCQYKAWVEAWNVCLILVEWDSMKWGHGSDDKGSLELDSEDVEVLEITMVASKLVCQLHFG